MEKDVIEKEIRVILGLVNEIESNADEAQDTLDTIMEDAFPK